MRVAALCILSLLSAGCSAEDFGLDVAPGHEGIDYCRVFIMPQESEGVTISMENLTALAPITASHLRRLGPGDHVTFRACGEPSALNEYRMAQGRPSHALLVDYNGAAYQISNY